MKHLSVKHEEEPEVIEPEIVGFERPLPLWKRLLARAAFGLVLGVVGAGLMLLGVVLTVTIVGAFIGIPLIVLGLALLAAALFLPMLRGRIKAVSFQWPPEHKHGR